MDKICLKCGTPLEGRDFCINCGEKNTSDIHTSETKHQNKHILVKENLLNIIFWIQWIILMAIGMLQAVACLSNIGEYYDIVNSWNGNLIYNIVFIVTGLLPLIGTCFVFLLRTRNVRNIIMTLTVIFTLLITLGMILFKFLFSDTVFDSVMTMATYNMSDKYSIISIPIFFGIILIVLFSVLKKYFYNSIMKNRGTS